MGDIDRISAQSGGIDPLAARYHVGYFYITVYQILNVFPISSVISNKTSLPSVLRVLSALESRKGHITFVVGDEFLMRFPFAVY